MGISRYRYLHYDVFTDRRFGGNQLAVFPSAGGLSAQTMQQIAREIGFAETTFVTTAERPHTDVRMRIFTPGTEMPMAGHPVVGSTFALARDGAIGAGRTDWTFGLNIGPRSEEHTSELQSQSNLVCRLLLEKKKNKKNTTKMQHTKKSNLNQYPKFITYTTIVQQRTYEYTIRIL